MAEETLRQTQLSNPEEGLALAPSGWHPVRASFEVDKVNIDRCGSRVEQIGDILHRVLQRWCCGRHHAMV